MILRWCASFQELHLISGHHNGMMNRIFLVAWFVLGFGCKNDSETIRTERNDNPTIKRLYERDIEIRNLDAITDTVNLETYDKVHREQIFQLLAENKVLTANDKIRASWILQHTAAKVCDGEIASLSSENFLLAYHLSSSALEGLTQQNDTATIRKTNVSRIVALTYDRYLLFTFGYQKFGTQFIFDDVTGEMLLAPIDTTLANDAERRTHNIESLSVLLEKYKMKTMPGNSGRLGLSQ